MKIDNVQKDIQTVIYSGIIDEHDLSSSVEGLRSRGDIIAIELAIKDKEDYTHPCRVIFDR